MPRTTFGVYPTADALTEGEQISSTYEGRHVTLEAQDLISAAGASQCVKGLPVIFGPTGLMGVGIAFNTTAVATDLVAIDTEGIWIVDVWAQDDGGAVAVAGGDDLYIDITPGSCVVSKIASAATNIPFGYALGTITTPGNKERIAVKVHWDPIDNWVLDQEPLFFGDAKDVSVQWNETFLAIAIEAVSKAVGLEMAISAAALADGYGFFETNANVAGASPGFVAARSDWLNLAADFEVMPGGGLITPHTDGIYEVAGATLTGATIALAGKFTDQMVSAGFGMYNLWNLNLTQTLTALFEVNNPALMGYIAGTDVTNVCGSIPFFHTGGGATKYIRLYSDAAA